VARNWGQIAPEKINGWDQSAEYLNSDKVYPPLLSFLLNQLAKLWIFKQTNFQ
jgi:hypothetical protein